MVFQRSILALVLVCAGELVSAKNFSLYAYGKGITPGLRLFYGDGQAYVGHSAPSFVSEAANVTLSQTVEDTEFLATPDRTIEGSKDLAFAIDSTEGVNNPVIFVEAKSTPASDIAVSGFGLYGGWAFHQGNGGPIAMNFLASPTNETDIYLVKWNGGATKADDDVSISLRTLAPVQITT